MCFKRMPTVVIWKLKWVHIKIKRSKWSKASEKRQVVTQKHPSIYEHQLTQIIVYEWG